HMQYTKMWHRLLHDRTSDQIATALADLPHANVTLVPYQLSSPRRRHEFASIMGKVAAGDGKRRSRSATAVMAAVCSPAEVPEGASPIADVVYRQRAMIAGRVRSMRVQPWSSVATLECTLVDNTG